MKKSVYALFLLVLCLFGFSSGNAFAEVRDPMETNAFRIERKSMRDGEISLSYIFPINSAVFKDEGFTNEQIQIYEFYLTSYVNALARSNSEKACDGVSVEKVKEFSDIDGIGFSINFENLDAQKKFFGVSDEDEKSQNNIKKKGFFVRKTQFFTTFPISSKKTAGDLKMVCLMAVSSWANNSSVTKEKKQAIVSSFDRAVYIYDFASETKGLKSDVMYSDGRFSHNVFIKTAGEIERNNQISFWVQEINTALWYMVALFVVFAGMIFACVWVKIAKRKKKVSKR